MRPFSMLPLQFLATAALLFVPTSATTSPQIPPDNTVLRWSSTGGGWRAMFGCVAFANVFRQAGLFTQDSTLFDAIATTSGATWFSTQLFYSQAFYNQTVLAESPQDLYEFVANWMTSYYRIAQGMEDIDIDAMLGTNMTNLMVEENGDDVSPITFLLEFFDLFQQVGGDWASFVEKMLQAAAEDYGHDGTPFSDIVANSENRIPALQKTHLLVQAAMVPTSRVRMDAILSQRNESDTTLLERILDIFNLDDAQDMTFYFGPVVQNDTEKLYTVPYPAAYTVNETFAGFTYATLDSNSGEDLMTYVTPTLTGFDFEEWNNFFLWGNNDTAQVKVAATGVIDGLSMDIQEMMSTGIMPRPFGGDDPTVIQLSAISSAAGGGLSPAAPSVFAQLLSLQRSILGEGSGLLALPAFDSTARTYYESELFDHLAVCSQWPHAPCHGNAGRFIDGGYVDNPTLAINVGQYHATANDAELTKTLKLVLTNANNRFNETWVNPTEIMPYFVTDFNRGIPPGDFVWGEFTPTRSPQIFGEYLSEEAFQSMMEPLNGSTMTTAIMKGTTIDNPAFGIRAGQKVEILLLNLNVPITTFIAGPSTILDTKLALANMVKDIADNQELVQRVKNFFFEQEDPLHGGHTLDASKSTLGTLRKASPQSSSSNSYGGPAETFETQPDEEDGFWLPSSAASIRHCLASLLVTWMASRLIE